MSDVYARFFDAAMKVDNDYQRGYDAALEAVKHSGWRSCIDHIIRSDSPCPVCRVAKLEELLGWVCSEIERDHELDRLSIDSETAVKAAREYLNED